MAWHIWTIDNWRKIYEDIPHRTGLRLRFDERVDPEVREEIKRFAKWLRTQYYFPVRVPIYCYHALKIQARDGDLVDGTCLMPDDRREEPYIRIAVGDYCLLSEKRGGKEDVLNSYCACIAHELTHYFQWINDLKLTDRGMERQATMYADYIMENYVEYKKQSVQE